MVDSVVGAEQHIVFDARVCASGIQASVVAGVDRIEFDQHIFPIDLDTIITRQNLVVSNNSVIARKVDGFTIATLEDVIFDRKIIYSGAKRSYRIESATSYT